MAISNELLDELLQGCKRPEDLLGDAGLMKELEIRLMERMLGAELTAHLGYEAGAEPSAEHGLTPLKWSTFWDSLSRMMEDYLDGRQTREAGRYRHEAASG